MAAVCAKSKANRHIRFGGQSGHTGHSAHWTQDMGQLVSPQSAIREQIPWLVEFAKGCGWQAREWNGVWVCVFMRAFRAIGYSQARK